VSLKNLYSATINTTNRISGKTNPAYVKLVKELEALKRRIVALDGNHVLFAHSVTGSIGAGSLSLIVDSGLVERAITPAMHMKPAAFRDSIAGGRMLPDKKRAVIANLSREVAAQRAIAMQRHNKLITNRKDFIEIYFEELNIFPSSKMGKFLNRSNQQSISRV
jgi:hypothetical protein